MRECSLNSLLMVAEHSWECLVSSCIANPSPPFSKAIRTVAKLDAGWNHCPGETGLFPCYVADGR